VALLKYHIENVLATIIFLVSNNHDNKYLLGKIYFIYKHLMCNLSLLFSLHVSVYTVEMNNKSILKVDTEVEDTIVRKL